MLTVHVIIADIFGVQPMIADIRGVAIKSSTNQSIESSMYCSY